MQTASASTSGRATSSLWSGPSAAHVSWQLHTTRRPSRCSGVERDLDWEPDTKPGPLMAPSRGGGPRKQFEIPPPPPPPPPRKVDWYEWPFMSRRNIALTLLGGSAGLWLINHKLGPVQFADKPDIPFKLLGFTDLKEEDFVYFKTAGGNWVGAAEDEQGRLFMIDQVGDLYYDSGDPDIGMYAMDTQGNLYNFYNDVDGERKITPVGNIADLKQFKVNEIAGVKLDRDVNVVAFEDGRQIPLPPGTGYVDSSGKYIPPGELVEGYTRSVDSNPFSRLFGERDPAFSPPDRLELDLQDPAPFSRQMFDQILLDDPDVEGFQPALPEDFDLEALAKQVEEEARSGKRR
mmetsp:Transcript_26196/g.57226  ORF Transcript_26196/g.57226 Transcript_26196/m.57226 type:complete len:347 (+) Transcript_26196:169-1209(+)